MILLRLSFLYFQLISYYQSIKQKLLNIELKRISMIVKNKQKGKLDII